MTTAEELRKAEARYQRAFWRAETERSARNTEILQAIAEGWTHAQIAEATGLTRARVGQIATAKPQVDPNPR
jgi:DNA-binding NarL/FixJ family response regulator